MTQIYDKKPLTDYSNTNTRVIRIDHHYLRNPKRKYSIACRISVISVDAPKEPYIAVSYMWGNTKSSEEILLDGKPFSIGSNLFDFLTMFRDGGHDDYLWIDALCINQSNTIERNHQVALMGRIYSVAEHVLVWLGKGDDELSGAMLYLQNSLWMQSPILQSLHWGLDRYEAEKEKRHTEEAIQHEQILKLIDEHPYWSRAWIVQELLMAREFSICCGAHSISGSKFCDYLQYVAESIANFENRDHPNPPVEWTVTRSVAAKLMRERALWQSDKPRYIHPWHRFDKTQCADVRDRVYSMLSFIDPNIPPIIPDYGKSLSAMFADLVDNQLRRDGSHDFIKSIWNLLEILDLDEDDETMRRYLDKWESKGILEYALDSRYKEDDDLYPSSEEARPSPSVQDDPLISSATSSVNSFNTEEDLFMLDLLDQAETLLERKTEHDRSYEYDDL